MQPIGAKFRPWTAKWLRQLLRWRTQLLSIPGRIQRLHPQAFYSGFIALVSVILLAPLLLDDLVLRSGYLQRTPADAIEISTPIVLSHQPSVTIVKGTLSVPPALSGKPRTGDALAALVKGGNARLILDGPVFQVALSSKSSDEPGNNGFGTGLPVAISPMLAALKVVTFEKLSIKDGTIRLVSLTGPDVVLSGINADVVVKRKTAMRIKGTMTMLGEMVSYDTTLGSRIERRGAIRMPLRATIRANPISAVIDGRLDWRNGPLLTAATAELTVPNVRTLARWLGPVWPSGPGLKDFSVSGGLDWSEGAIAVHKGVFRMDGNEANGELQLDLNGERPAVSGTLAASSIDLSPYVSATSAPEDAGLPLLARFKAARDLTMPLLGYINADVRFSTDKVRLGSVEAERAAAGLNLRDGRLLLDLADLAIPGGGQARGELTVEGWTTMPNYTIRGGIERANMPSLTAALTGMELVSGIGNVTVDLTASGASGNDVLSKLDGRIGLNLPVGGTIACSMASITAAAKALVPPIGGPCATVTTVGPLKSGGSLSHGILTLDQVEAKAGGDDVRLTGSIDVLTRIMDLGVSSRSAGTDNTGGDKKVTVRGRPEAPTLSVREP